MIELKRSAEKAEVEKVELFSIDGKVYEVPAKPPLTVALKYLTEMRTLGSGFAEMALLERLLGEEGYTALLGFDELTPEVFGQVVDAATELALGLLEDKPEGNDDSGSGS